MFLFSTEFCHVLLMVTAILSCCDGLATVYLPFLYRFSEENSERNFDDNFSEAIKYL